MVDASMIDEETMARIMGKPAANPAEDALKEQLPIYGRIQVPIRAGDKSTLKECAALLRSLSEEMRILGDRHDISQTIALHRAYGLIQSANYRMKDSTKYRIQK